MRRSIPAAQRAGAARQIARHADRALKLRSGQRIGIYAATAEEVDTSLLIALALRRGCHVYLPSIDRRSRVSAMRFVQLTDGASPRALRVNRFGIAEPQGPQLASARLLDVVFLPLVGFDRHGMRLGMGGGYYDRAFAFRRLRSVWHAPLLVGIAYAIQEVERIAPAAHDVPLDLVITERGVTRFVRR
jgi:5-formyltetrahydrofolate cyclo-ligase